MNPITLQDIINNAYQAFIVEKRPPAYDTTSSICRYLTADGRKCAIGTCIPDGHPAQLYPGLFSQVVSKFPELFDEQLNNFSEHDLDILQQALHDAYIDEQGQWRDGYFQHMVNMYHTVAWKYDLTLPQEAPA